jgi:hypothetical protein
MSFSLNEVYRLERTGGAALQRHQELVAQADASAHGSLAEQELGAFRALWLQDPNLAAEQARTLLAARG